MINCKSFEFKMTIFNNSNCYESGIVSTFSVSPCSDFGLIKFFTENSGVLYGPIYEINNCSSKLDYEDDQVREIASSNFQFGKCQPQPRSKISYLYSIDRNQTIPQKSLGKCNSITFLYNNDQDRLNNKPNCNFIKIRSYDNGTCYENPLVRRYEKLMCIGDEIITYRCGNDSQCQDSNCYPFDQFPSNSTIYDNHCKNIIIDDNNNNNNGGSKNENSDNNKNVNKNNNNNRGKENDEGRIVNSTFSNNIKLNSKLLQILITISILISILI
ncbi:hypothetical protein RB653_002805 [Dictyostelium firmibasis]|uniref:Uncharacterized protein n=1 Tax=Dictyostelium firmibasis TaxID=79012 RepID=A0AAN7TX47_9MYCE